MLSDASGPVLSIGMIFRNNIRSLERCLKALGPLRGAVSCELVMADTGSEDGSRAVAEQYADVLFDFPWVGDFAAARNAVIRKSTGKWFISVDTDEYLDEDVSELLDFLRTDGQGRDAATVVIRNYHTYEMDENYSDFFALRMMRASLGNHYAGAIHEYWVMEKNGKKRLQAATLMKTVFHHDGYVELNDKNKTEKRERNITPLRANLEKNPDNLRDLMQFIESGDTESDYPEIIRRAVKLVEQESAGWQVYGPAIVRYAVTAAQNREWPEMETWLEQARRQFPDSFYTRIDVEYNGFVYYFRKKDHLSAIQCGKTCLAAYEDYRAGRGDIIRQMYSTLVLASPYAEQNLRLFLAESFQNAGRPGEALSCLETLRLDALDEKQTGSLLERLWNLHSGSTQDTAALLAACWDSIERGKPDEERAKKRRAVFVCSGSALFSDEFLEQEKDFFRRAYTVFLPLAGRIGLGTAAAILTTDDPGEIRDHLCTVTSWQELPTPALVHALACGVDFPVRENLPDQEGMKSLAVRLARSGDGPIPAGNAGTDLHTAAWRHILLSAAAEQCGWEDARQDMETARQFAAAEKAFLSRYYTGEALQTLDMLPPPHRFGWYCAQAFDALDAGDAAGYVRLLREGLTSCESMKNMVEFLLEHTPELQIPEPKPSGELLELAEKVRGMLAAYAPDDPAVMMIRQNPIYQKVAHLIEGPEVGIYGGLAQ